VVDGGVVEDDGPGPAAGPQRPIDS